MWLLAITGLIFLAGPTGWWATDVLEADDDFCNSCHLPNGEPLHTEIRDDFDNRPPVSLAARHAAALLPDRPDSPSFRCIDCHGGVGFLGRARVKLLSVKDSMLYVTGRFDEPDEMSTPLGDADCRRCHQRFAKKAEGFDGEAFHNRTGHNVDLGVACVECHTTHTGESRPDLWFLRPDHVRARCGQCHVEYAGP